MGMNGRERVGREAEMVPLPLSACGLLDIPLELTHEP